MDPTGATYVAIANLIVSAVSTGVGVYGQMQQAESAQNIADYNAQVQQNNAQLQAQIAMRNAQIQAQGAQYSAQAAQAQYEAGMNNATVLAQQARSVEEASRIQAEQQREENQRLLARQRARYAAAGVVSSEGSPLAVLAETAGRLELGVQNQMHEANLQARELDWRSKIERYNAGFSLLDAAMDSYGGDVALWRGELAQLGASVAEDEAELTRWSGVTEAQGYRLGALGSLLGGVGGMAGDAYRYYDMGAFGTPKKTEKKK